MGLRLRMTMRLLPILIIGMVFAGCDDGESSSGPPPQFRKGKGTALGAPSIEAREALEKQGAGLVVERNFDKSTMELPLPPISETDFIESNRRRDPFRPFMEVISPAQTVRETVQREIKLEEYDIEQLKLIAIITNVGDPRAMVVPPNGVGHVLRVGDYVGRPDFVDPGSGGERIQINWKVYRIHGAGKEEERGVYLVRDDPLTATPNDITRFLPLHTQN
jgi:type IV pilus assembly protein PilP